ncbi:hypothetical protein GE21DRAFT_1309027 [Neurospora crassa]|nr:hypothetical protein GE21DRAFT_1309027 [Neurospora crassa]
MPQNPLLGALEVCQFTEFLRYTNERNVGEITWRSGTSLILSCFRQAWQADMRSGIVEDKCDVDALRAAGR